MSTNELERAESTPVTPDVVADNATLLATVDPTEGGKLCGRRTRANPGGTCRRFAGHGTDHKGIGACKFHGGSNPIRSGRYSTIKRQRLRDLIEHMAADDEPLNVLHELDAARALFVDFINRYDDILEATLAWYESWAITHRPLPEDKALAFERVVDEWENELRTTQTTPTAKQEEDLKTARAFIDILRGNTSNARPRQMLDIAEAYKIVESITRMAEREWKRIEANAISRRDLNRIIEAMGRSILRHVTDEGTRKAIRDEWLQIAIAS